jgi:hypothetical protein
MSDPITIPIKSNPVKRPNWLNKKFFLYICIWYLLSPKIGTIFFWYSIKPSNYASAVTRVYGANKEANGDILVCLDLTNSNDLELKERIGVRLPVSNYIDAHNSELQKWNNSISPFVSNSFAIQIKPSVEPCQEQKSGLFVISESSLDPGRNALVWKQYNKKLTDLEDFLVVDVKSVSDFKYSVRDGRTFGYLDRKINREIYELVEVGSSPEGDSIKIKSLRQEHYLEFYFPLEQSGIRWKNIGLIRYVVYDIVGGPLAWFGIFTPIFTSSRS